ncbi:MAG: hypothetical protein ABI175_23690 [Polyangiales bacterium]
MARVDIVGKTAAASVCCLLALGAFAAIGANGCSSSDSGGNGGDGDAGVDTNGGFQPDVGVRCPDGVTTRVTGKVYYPAKSSPDPLYNAAVFIPDGPVKRFSVGVSCDRCGENTGTKVLTSTLTGGDGKFVLDNVPAGKNVPLVIQIGKWRRQIVIPEVKACSDTALTPEQTRLPRNKAEGDIPLTAIVTGRADPLECVLRKMGIDDAEFTEPLPGGSFGTGRIHVFKSAGGVDIGPTGTISGKSLWKDLDYMKRFDVILLPCEGTARTSDKDPADMQRMADYAAAGGRVFATHYSYVWFQSSPDAGWKNAATWVPTGSVPSPLPGFINTTFPKGKAMADWLQAVGATTTLGQLDITDPRVDSPSANPPSQTWITSKAPVSTQSFSFNTPTTAKPEDQCGRVVYSDFHVVGSDDFSPITFPAECTDSPLTAQERVIEFMLFDLASCVQKDDETPKPPR